MGKNYASNEVDIPVDFMMETIRKIYANDRFFSYDSMMRTCKQVETIMKEIGLIEVHTYQFPADGKIAHGGWMMPPAWNPESSLLEVIHPDGRREEICSYEKTPCSLMLYSTSCDITADLALENPDTVDYQGKMVMNSGRMVNGLRSRALYQHGASVILGNGLRGLFAGTPGYEYLDDACQWTNYEIPYQADVPLQTGFSLTPNQAKYLKKLLAKNGKVTLHAKVETEIKPGTIPLVTALLPGETNEEIVFTGHLFEQGANDNASGCALMLAMLKDLSGKKKRKRGIRIMLTHEIKSLQAYLNTVPRIPHFIAGIDIDMVGGYKR